jgi:hypothetical protein
MPYFTNFKFKFITTFILFSTLLILHAHSDKEEEPIDHPQRHGRETFEQKHMDGGKHDPEMDHKAILGMLK